MSDTEMTMVHVENDEAAAQIVVGFLESNGIDAMISEDDAGDQLPSLESVRGVQVFVPAADADRARELLAERESGD
jgi:hypothetical protein